jgi:hypothetical protein
MTTLIVYAGFFAQDFLPTIVQSDYLSRFHLSKKYKTSLRIGAGALFVSVTFKASA